MSAMKDLITEYGFNYNCFCTFFSNLDAVISGGAALATYLVANNLPSFTPSDIDIWVQPPSLLRIADYVIFTSKILRYFTDFKYVCSSIKTGNYADYTESSEKSKHQDNIECVMTFTQSTSEKTVQVIWLNVDPYTAINTSFDLSCCTVVWTPSTRRWWTSEFETIERGEMYLLPDITRNNRQVTDKQKARIAKYESRGFKLRPGPPPPIMFRRDPRRFRDDPKITAHDIITLEEHDIKQYVEAYDNNIIIRCGNNYYAYNREYLTEYIEEHQYTQATKKYSALPMRIAITYPDGATHYADWSIYICRPTEQSVITDRGQRTTLHTLDAYTVAQFEELLAYENK
jgi:hypothetical protein